MLKNIEYFKISQNNPEAHLDESYFVIGKFSELASYVSGIREIKEILITIKKLRESDEKEEL